MSKKEKIINLLESRGFEHVGEGRHRIGFRRRNIVIKVPKTGIAEFQNFNEAKLSYDNDNFARCKSIELYGVVCCVMEYLIPIDENAVDLPDWVNWVDCKQVGFSRKGNLKAYDFA